MADLVETKKEYKVTLSEEELLIVEAALANLAQEDWAHYWGKVPNVGELNTLNDLCQFFSEVQDNG